MNDGPALSTRKALAHLDEMAEQWSKEVDCDAMATAIADKDDRESRIVALLKQAFVEGAYRCFCDGKDGKIPALRPVQEIAQIRKAAEGAAGRWRDAIDRQEGDVMRVLDTMEDQMCFIKLEKLLGIGPATKPPASA